jgi:hypothetical protein
MISSRSVSGATIRCHSDYDGDDAAAVCIDKHQIDNREGHNKSSTEQHHNSSTTNPFTHNEGAIDSWQSTAHRHAPARTEKKSQ